MSLRGLIYAALSAYRENRTPGERFGDWASRLGPQAVSALAAGKEIPAVSPAGGE